MAKIEKDDGYVAISYTKVPYPEIVVKTGPDIRLSTSSGEIFCFSYVVFLAFLMPTLNFFLDYLLPEADIFF
jgi:hypothetical protein